jgi:sec-independent protein translocase protein TatB
LVLFILESLGTSELILIGIIALIFLGPRKLPEMARKAGKIMSEFRGTASEFKETWQREVNFEEEAKLLNIKDLDNESGDPGSPSSLSEPVPRMDAPQIKEADLSQFTDLADARSKANVPPASETPSDDDAQNDKKNWL